MKKRVLIVTAGFGEGHNTAAKNIRAALLSENPDSEVLISDLYAVTNPRLNRMMQAGYRFAINRATTIWHTIYKAFDYPGAIESTLPLIAKMRDAFLRQIESFRPDAVVSTYPIYGFVKDEITKKGNAFTMPFFTMVTDSTLINSAWYRRPSTAFLVPDQPTKDCLLRKGVDEKIIHALGFPVALCFENLRPVLPDATPPWKVLIMPSTRRSVALRILTAVLARKDTTATIVAGRCQYVLDGLENSPFSKDPRCKILGWTDKMPELLAEHHLFIGKAGGATVQEAIAAQCPILISHVVPGQEEGNIALILQNQIGALANTNELMKNSLDLAFDHEAATWRNWKCNIAQHSRCDASRNIARFILTNC
ncbi:MAG: hypothetical protein ABI443_01740 [Chthoniobacterales bacterium]